MEMASARNGTKSSRDLSSSSSSSAPPTSSGSTVATSSASDPNANPPAVSNRGSNSVRPGRFYSGRHPVPRIESYWELYPNNSTPPPLSPTAGELDACEREHKRNIGEHTRIVTDPITGKRVSICDAKYAPPKEVPQTTKEVYPPEQWSLFMEHFRALTVKYVAFVVCSFIILSGCLRLPFSLSILVAFAGGITWWRSVDSGWENFIYSVESDQGKQKMRVPGIRGNESVEWLNGVISKLWPQINSDLFTPMVDLLEDVMQASIPSIVTQVKVVNVGQGATPVRVLSLRWLDEENENNKMSSDTQNGATDRLNEQEQVGEWASLELSFAYRAQPSSSSASSKAKNANLLVHFYMGLNGFFGAPIPVWVELRGATGTCRMKIQLTPDPPFVKLGTFTLLGMPKIEIAAVPMNQRFFNVMNLPVISDFIYSSIRAAARQFVAPANYTLDLAKVINRDDTKKELLAIGILVVHIHSARGLRAADVDGKSDCYVTLSFSKSAKPLWSTRIIFNELNPTWDETAVLLLNADEVKAAENLSVQLWDSDRFTADDILGRTELEVSKLIRSPGKVWEHDDNLMGVKDGSDMPGTIKWSVVYYGNRALNKTLETDGGDERLPQDLKYLETKTLKKGPSQPEEDVVRIPPDPAFPSGILSIQLHNIIGLERQIISGSKSSSGIRRGQAQSTQEEEEGSNLPSAYCSIILDYQKIYRTRVKPMTSKPFFNAGCERFVRDWTKTKVMVVVRDSRLREEDPILGVVDLSLKDVLVNASQICRYYPIRGGVGYGKVQISLLFRSVDTVLPRAMLGTDIGSIEIVSHKISLASITDPDIQKADIIKFATPLIKKKAVKSPDGSGWRPVHNTHGSTGFRLGVRYRHSASCILYFRRDSRVRRDKTLGVAVLWLKDIPDEEIVHLSLPVYRPTNLERFIQNCGTTEGVQVGSVHVAVKFHRGLGHSHRRAALVEKDFRDVIDASACVEQIRGEAPIIWHSDNDTSSSEDENQTLRARGMSSASYASSKDSQESVGQGPIGGLKRHLVKKREESKELHRMERGVMQWKGTRTLVWVGEGIKEKGREVRGALKMEPRRPDVETEAR